MQRAVLQSRMGFEDCLIQPGKICLITLTGLLVKSYIWPSDLTLVVAFDHLVQVVPNQINKHLLSCRFSKKQAPYIAHFGYFGMIFYIADARRLARAKLMHVVMNHTVDQMLRFLMKMVEHEAEH